MLIYACRWEPNSFGYSGADGKKLHTSRLEDYAEPFSTGDVVGAGIHLARQELFFTYELNCHSSVVGQRLREPASRNGSGLSTLQS